MDATPASYLEWMVANFSGAEIRDSCRRELTRRAKKEMDAAKPERKTRKRRRDALWDEYRAIVGPAPKVWQPVESREGEPCPFDVVVEAEQKLSGRSLRLPGRDVRPGPSSGNEQRGGR